MAEVCATYKRDEAFSPQENSHFCHWKIMTERIKPKEMQTTHVLRDTFVLRRGQCFYVVADKYERIK